MQCPYINIYKRGSIIRALVLSSTISLQMQCLICLQPSLYGVQWQKEIPSNVWSNKWKPRSEPGCSPRTTCHLLVEMLFSQIYCYHQQSFSTCNASYVYIYHCAVCSGKRRDGATYEATSENPDQNQDAVRRLLVLCWLKCFSHGYTALIKDVLPRLTLSLVDGWKGTFVL